MSSCGYVTFNSIDCVYIIENDGIRLIPTQKENVRELNAHFDDQDFLFHFSSMEYKNCVSHIDRVEMNAGGAIRLIPSYYLKLLNNNPISSMRITGPSIDEVFHPAGYYYSKHESGAKNDTDLTRDLEIADHWSITIGEERVDVSLQPANKKSRLK